MNGFLDIAFPDLRLVRAADLVKIDCPDQASELGRRLAHRDPGTDPDAAAAALLRGDLIVLRSALPVLDPWDGTTGRPLQDLGDADQPTSRPSAEEPAPTSVQIEYTIAVVDESGQPCVDACVCLHSASGSRTVALDREGRFSDSVEAGARPTRMELLERVELSPVDAEAEPRLDGPRTELSNRSGASAPLHAIGYQTVVVRRAVVDVFEIEDLAFPFDGRIFRADGVPSGEGYDATAGLDVFRVVLQFAAAHPDASIVVAGHTDSVGADDFNEALSGLRARNVLAYLVGDRQEWIDLCVAQQHDADFRAAVDFVAMHEGQVLDIEPDAIGWGRIYDAYDQVLAASLETDAAGLAERRGHLKLLGDGVLACGESWPAEAVRADGFACQANRRVEILFVDEQQVDPAVMQAQPPGTGIYDGSLRPRYISPHGEAHRVSLLLRLRVEDDVRLRHVHRMCLRSGDGVVDRELELPEEIEGEHELRFEDLDPARRYTLAAYNDASPLPQFIFEDLAFRDIRHVPRTPTQRPPTRPAKDIPQET